MKKTLIASAALLLAFILAALARANHEFLFYAAALVPVLGVLALLDRRLDFSGPGLWAFNAWLLLHLLGGMASVGGVRLYDLVLVRLLGPPYDVLRYDQAVHVFCYVAIAILVHEAVSRLVTGRPLAVAVLTVLAASGIGGLNEILEFTAVIVVGGTGVGGYVNNALDLVANLLGALAGTGLCMARRQGRRPGPASP